jgi:2-iminobutanoate/2-iminopropanoate deaminase
VKHFIGGTLPVPVTPAIRCGNLLFISGQVPTGPDGSIPEGIAAQADLVLRKIRGLAEEAGFTLQDVVKTTVFLRDMADFDEMNKIYRDFFPQSPPARSCVKAAVAIDARIEIEAIAMKAV